jgi:hypothetical protein
MVTVSDPLEQVPDDVMDAVTEVVPVVTNCAKPGVEENASIEVSPDVQVALFVTSLLLLSVAVNCTLGVVDRLNGCCALELMVRVCPVPPVTLPVADPFTPPTDAVIVTAEAVPRPFTVPALTVAHGVELVQLAVLVTSLEPLLKLAVACSCTVDPWATVKVFAPASVVTETELGWLTKNPVHPAPNTSKAAIPMIQPFCPKLRIFRSLSRTSLDAKNLQNCSREIHPNIALCTNE